jgi:hypothetical protein
MGIISLFAVMPASWVADHMGRKWTIVPSCLGLACALLLMAATGMSPSAFDSYLQLTIVIIMPLTIFFNPQES